MIANISKSLFTVFVMPLVIERIYLAPNPEESEISERSKLFVIIVYILFWRHHLIKRVQEDSLLKI